MEPTVSIIHIDKEIKFKKADIESMKCLDDGIKSQDFRVCNISNVQYYLWIRKLRNAVDMKVLVKSGKATNIIVDLEYSIVSSPESSKAVKWEYSKNGENDVCFISNCKFDTKKCNIYINDQLIAKIKGNFKITLPSEMKYPISATWKIKEADLEALRTENGSLESKEFDVSTNSDIKYSIAIYSNYHGGQALICLYSRSKKDLSMIHEYIVGYLPDSANYSNASNGYFSTINLFSTNKIKSVFYISIDFANYSRDDEKTICPTEELFNSDNRYFVDGELTITVTGVLLAEKENVDPISLQCDKAIEADQTCNGKNFTIEVGDKKIMVHKQLLLDSSSYFIGLFNSGMIESIKMKTTITDFDYEIVEAGIQFLYDPKIPTNFNFEQMLELLRFSDKYDIQLIKDGVQKFLIEKLSPMNVCPIINFTKTTVDAPILKKKCMEFLVKCMKEEKAVHGLETLDKETMLQTLIGTSAKFL